MQPRIVEKNKKAGICYAATEDGIELPIIDVTHPSFAVQLSTTELNEFSQKQLRELKRQENIPVFLQRLFFSLMQRRSVLMRGIAGAAGTFMSGMNTYMLKLGPDNLNDGYASNIDRQIAASLPALSARLRLQDMAYLLVEGLTPTLGSDTKAALHLLNIGGGPAIDSVNALLLLLKEQPAWLPGRQIFIHSLDRDHTGPSFGARALDSLRAEGGPLHGLGIRFSHVKYDWSEPGSLRELVTSFDTSEEIVAAVSSEGALFEYGTDDEITANLRTLHEILPAESVIVGTVTRADDIGRLLNGASRAAIKLRGLEAFTTLALRAGWKTARVIDRPMSHDVLMKKA